MKKIILTCIITVLLTACAHQKSAHQMAVVFNEQDFAPYTQLGLSSIAGQVFLKTRGGEVRYGASEEVTLIPVTPYSSELWQASLRGEIISNLDPRYKKYTKTAVADGSGNFEFTDLPAGDYYVESSVYWEIPTGNSYQPMERTGGVVKAITKVAEGQQVKIMLTDQSSSNAQIDTDSSYAGSGYQPVYTGKRGGKYVITSGGNKRYLSSGKRK